MKQYAFQASDLQSWPKMSGQFPKFKMKYLASSLPPCNAVMLLRLCTVQMISVAINITWGRGGLPEIHNDSTINPYSDWLWISKTQMYKFQKLFSYLSREILVTIAGLIYDNGIFCFFFIFVCLSWLSNNLEPNRRTYRCNICFSK